MNNYGKLKNAYPTYKASNEKFFVSYAVRGDLVDKEHGDRLGMPSLYPLEGPVNEPSPLNTRWKYIPKMSSVGIL
jgi:hypothetical protein